MRPITRIAPDVGWLPISFANVYFIGRPGDGWIMADAGLPGSAQQITAAVNARFGAGARPEGIVLTHGHFDHAGSALALARHWDVPIYVHRLELPYLTGRSSYPPPDPTVGGAMAFLSRFIPTGSRDLTPYLIELKSNEIPGLGGWEWFPTPGHTPGHIAFFRSSDRVLIAGDAFATTDMDSWSGLFSHKQRLARAGTPFNYDWGSTQSSIRKLAELRPKVAACGHGIPMTEGDLADQMSKFADRFRPPKHGRYVQQPARTDESGVVALPRAPFDPVPFATAAGLLFVGIALGAGYLDDA
jgi:glyoxylase-like metal-dependent hydrolase (beta-lactamase superfamily II)